MVRKWKFRRVKVVDDVLSVFFPPKERRGEVELSCGLGQGGFPDGPILPEAKWFQQKAYQGPALIIFRYSLTVCKCNNASASISFSFWGNSHQIGILHSEEMCLDWLDWDGFWVWVGKVGCSP